MKNGTVPDIQNIYVAPTFHLGPRIIAVADYYDSTVNPSTEFWAKTKAKAKEELFSASGSLFDPDVVKAFIDVLG